MRMKRLTAWLAALVICAGGYGIRPCAAADALGDELSAWFGGEGETRLSATFKLDTLLPFEETGLATINDVAQYLQLDAAVSDASATLALSVGEDTIFTLAESARDGASRLTTSLLPNRTLVARTGSALDLLAGQGAGAEDGAPFSLPDALAELEARAKALTDACAPYAEEKKANYRIDGIGRARLSRIARLNAESGEAALAPIVATLACGMDEGWRALLSEAAGVKKGFVVALYQTADGDDLALYMRGSLLMADGAEMSVKFQWAFLRGDESTDTYSCEASLNRKPRQSRAVKASRTAAISGTKLSITLKSDATLKTGAATDATSVAVKLTGKASASATTLAGSLTTTNKQTAGGKTVKTETVLSPDLKLAPKDGARLLTGTVAYSQTRDKLAQLALSIAFGEGAQAAQPYDPYSVTEAEGERAVEVVILSGDGEERPLETAETNEYRVGAAPIGLAAFEPPKAPVEITINDVNRDALLQEAAQTLAGRLLVALSALPGDDSALLWDNMTETDVQAFLSLLESR